MGFNTTVVVMNDALGDIASDPEFGARLARAIQLVSRDKPVVVSAGRYANAATVIETHHADYEVLVRVGGNRGEVVRGGK